MTIYLDSGNITATLANITNLLNQVLQQGVKIMADEIALQQAIVDLQNEVAEVVANMDKLMADLTAALGTNDQPGIDAATAAIEAQVQALKDVVAKDPAP